jgi:hypothetical protein
MNDIVNLGGISSILPRKKKPELNRVLRQGDLIDIVNKLSENMQLLIGQTADTMERAVTYKDLVDAGYDIGQFAGEVPSSISPPLPPTDKPNLGVPPVVSGISVLTTFEFAHLSWDAATYSNHAFVLIYRAPAWTDEAGTIPSVFSDAVYLVSSPTIAYSDKLLPEDEMRYFFQNISDEGIVGPVSAGFYAKTAPKPSYLIDKISGEIKQGDLFAALSSKIDTSSSQAFAGFTTSASNEDIITTSYTVKIDVDGVIAGFGLMNQGGVTSFGIRADQFWIAPVTGPASETDAAIPFIVSGGDVFIKNAFIDTAYIETLVAGQITADYINTLNLTAVNITGGTLTIGNDFDVDITGVMHSLNAVIENSALKNVVIRDSLNNVVFQANGVIENAQVSGLGSLALVNSILMASVTDAGALALADSILMASVTDAGALALADNITSGLVTDFSSAADARVNVVVDTAFIDTLYSSTIFAGQIFAQNIEGDVTDLFVKTSTGFSNSALQTIILTFTVASLPFTRSIVVSEIIASVLSDFSNNIISAEFKLKTGATVWDTFIGSAFAPAPASNANVFCRALIAQLPSNTARTYTVTIETVSGTEATHVAQGVILQAFQKGTTIT